MPKCVREETEKGPQGRCDSSVPRRHAGHHQADGTARAQAPAQAQTVTKPVPWIGLGLRVPLYERGGKQYFRSPETGREIEAGKFTFGYLGQKSENQP